MPRRDAALTDDKALLKAIAGADRDAVKRLLEKDSDLVEAWRPLYTACRDSERRIDPARDRARVGIVADLLDAGADPNALPGHPRAMLPLTRVVTQAPRAASLEILDLLLQAGGDPVCSEIRKEGVYTPLSTAARYGHLEYVERMRPRAGALDIFHAAVLGDSRRVRYLLRREPSLAALNEGGGTALWYVACSGLARCDAKIAKGLLSCAEALLEAGAGPDFTGPERDSVLHNAVGHAGHWELAELLIERGADVNGGGTLLHAHRHYEFLLEGLEWLRDHGADLDIRHGSDGRTALHFAADYGWVKATQKLLELGADPRVRDDSGETPLDLARAQHVKGVVTALESA